MATDMMGRICAHLNNWFCAPDDVVTGEWTISDGAIDLTGIVLPGQYFRIVGSALNDGVYQYAPEDTEGNEPESLTDETFVGEIWPMRVPRDMLGLCAEIEAWQTQYGAAMASPYQSESVIGVYSYTKAAGSASGSTSEAWADIFRSRLNQWRRL